MSRVFDGDQKLPTGGTLRGAFVGICCALAMAACLWSRVPQEVTDSVWYIMLSEGKIASVGKPFVSRVLYPCMAGFVRDAWHLSTPEAFRLVALISLAALGAVVGALAVVPRRGVWVAVVVLSLLTPAFYQLFWDAYLPDVCHAAFAAVFIFLLGRMERGRGWLVAASIVLAVSFLVRESSLLLVVVAVFIAWRRHHVAAAVSFALAGLAGWVTIGFVSRLGNGNIHHMNEMVYLAFKVPFNFTKNVLGVELWTNTFAESRSDYTPPVWVTQMPAWLPFGAIKQIGFCAPSVALPLWTLVRWLSTFGIAPMVAWLCFKQRRFRPQNEEKLWVAVAATYGWIAFFLGPCLGASVGRLVAYGWPLFWLALPQAQARWLPRNPMSRLVLAGLHLSAAWLPVATLYVHPDVTLGLIVAMTTGLVVFHWLAWRLVSSSGRNLEKAETLLSPQAEC